MAPWLGRQIIAHRRNSEHNQHWADDKGNRNKSEFIGYPILLSTQAPGPSGNSVSSTIKATSILFLSILTAVSILP